MIKKYKLTDLAKDLKIPSAELVEALSGQFGAKKPSASLSPDEVNYIFELYTLKNQVESFDQYFADKSVTPRPEPKKAAEQKDAPKQGAKPEADVESEKKKSEEEPSLNAEILENQAEAEPIKAAEKPAEQIKELDAPPQEQKKVQETAAGSSESPKAVEKQRRREEKKPAKKQDHGERQRLITSGSGSMAQAQQRVEDTRGSYVNIDKYNEKYDNLADSGRKNNENYQKKQKLVQKSKQQKSSNFPQSAKPRLKS